MTIHAEVQWKDQFGDLETVAYSFQTMEDAFQFAAVYLLRGHNKALIWPSGIRNVPLTITKENYERYFLQWVENV